MLISRIAWALFFLFFILHFSHHWTGHQALGLSNIINRLVDVFPLKVIIKLSHQTVASFLEAMTYLTCNFQEAAMLNMVCSARIFLCQISIQEIIQARIFFNLFGMFQKCSGGVVGFFKTFFKALKCVSKKIWNSYFL